MYRLSRKSIKHSDAKKLKAGHVLCVEHTKRFQRTFLDCLSGNKKRGAEVTHGQSHVCRRTLEFCEENFFGRRLHQFSFIVRITLYSPFDKLPSFVVSLSCLSWMVLQLNPPADCSLVWPPPRALNLLPGRHSFRSWARHLLICPPEIFLPSRILVTTLKGAFFTLEDKGYFLAFSLELH